MTGQSESVITPERFQQGLSWQSWLEQLQSGRQSFENNYAQTTLHPSDVAAIKQMMAMPRGPNVWGVSRHGPGKVLALCEPGCPDVLLGLPVTARLCQATGMELRILSSDANPDIMAEVLYRGEFRAIPTFIFYTRSDEYLGHWIEMPALAREQHDLLDAAIIGDAFEAFQQGEVWAGWRQALISEVRDLLAAGLERARAVEEARDMAFFD